MIWIDKGPAPEILLNDGAAFQERAKAFEKNFVTVVPQKPKGRGRKKSSMVVDDDDDDDEASAPSTDPLSSYAKVDSEGQFNGFESKLFSVFSWYSAPDVKAKLIQSHHGKCAFCESFIMDTDVGDVEHYRPKAEVKERDPSSSSVVRAVPDHPGYYWLSQTWANLFLSCKQCNQAFKGNRFDVAPDLFDDLFPRNRITTGDVEKALLLNPGKDVGSDPRQVIRFDPATAEAVAVSSSDLLAMPSAQSTITTVGLNRPRLLEARAAHLVKLRALFVLAASAGGTLAQGMAVDIRNFQFPQPSAGDDAKRELINAVQPSAEYSALAMDAIEQWNAELRLQQPNTCALSFQQPQQQFQVNVNLALTLKPWIDLHEQRRAQAVARISEQSAPDTTALDTDYNSTLAKYKVICRRISASSRALLSIEQNKIQPLQQALAALRAERLDALQRITQNDDDDPLFTAEEAIRQASKARTDHQQERLLLERSGFLASGQKDAAYAGVTTTYHAQRILELSTLSVDERGQKIDMANQQITALTSSIGTTQQRLDALQQAAAPYQPREDALLDLIDGHEHARSQYFYELFELQCDATDAAEGYHNCRAPSDREKRANALSEAASQMSDFLYDLGTPAEPVASHLQAKAFPASIRLKS